MLKRLGDIKQRFVVLLGALMLLTHIWSCGDSRMISESDMQSIITEMLITNSLLTTSDAELKQKVDRQDSTNYYASILERKGYTFEDFRYTVESMNARKSNPMDDILERVVEGIDREAAAAEYRYKIAMKFDSAAMKRYTDTIFYDDTTIVGNPSGYRVDLAGRIEPGNYELRFTYHSIADYNYPQKSVRYYFDDANTKIPARHRPTVVWLNRNREASEFVRKLNFPRDKAKDSLVVMFAQNKMTRQIVNYNDTSFVSNILITYTPELEVLRKRFHYSFFGEDFIINREYITPKPIAAKMPFSLIDTLRVENYVDSLVDDNQGRVSELAAKASKQLRLKSLEKLNKQFSKDSTRQVELVEELRSYLMINYQEAADSIVELNKEIVNSLDGSFDSLLKLDTKFRADSIAKAKKK